MWTVIKEDEDGNAITTREFSLLTIDILYTGNFKLIRYLDPYGDTTFNTPMFPDLIDDLTNLKIKIPADKEQIEEVLKLAGECINEVDTYLKFYGD